MPNRIAVTTEESWESEHGTPAWLVNIEPFMQKVLTRFGYDGEELSVLFCGDAFMQQLNSEYRQIDAPTDVLSFENGDSYTDDEGTWKCAGDIVVSLETLPRNAGYFKVSENDELKRLLVHGTLHLNGMDHGEEHVEPGVVPTDEMLALQERVLPEFKDINLLAAAE